MRIPIIALRVLDQERALHFYTETRGSSGRVPLAAPGVVRDRAQHDVQAVELEREPAALGAREAPERGAGDPEAAHRAAAVGVSDRELQDVAAAPLGLDHAAERAGHREHRPEP